ncbi:pyridoxal-phosphate dependent enzyme [Reichenbachiella sp. MALMAid0571]|uniref:pyridoxal-phosphate dependent enzyme n=1 Tax=Reichenbachiella sp. MALMAid0571 TaxID=3143939 RepID=UPI0032DFC055
MYLDIPNFSEIKRAHQKIVKFITKTPVLTSHSIDDIVGAKVFLKCENFQKVGSFKMRGATNVIMSYLPEQRTNGFATHSSGNHAQAVALAAKLAGTKAYIVIPENASEVKKNAVIEYGAEVVFCEPTEAAREDTCAKILEETNAIFVPPFNDSRIIAGQATAAKELIEEQPDLDYIVTPVGGGGLAAGTALAANYVSPTTKVILGEPENVNDTYKSFKTGKLTPVGKKTSIADGLLVSLGELNFRIIKEYVDDVVTVKEEEIVSAMKLIWERMKIIIEPSSAVAIATIIKEKDRFAGKNVGVIVTGGNVDLTALPF